MSASRIFCLAENQICKLKYSLFISIYLGVMIGLLFLTLLLIFSYILLLLDESLSIINVSIHVEAYFLLV